MNNILRKTVAIALGMTMIANTQLMCVYGMESVPSSGVVEYKKETDASIAEEITQTSSSEDKDAEVIEEVENVSNSEEIQNDAVAKKQDSSEENIEDVDIVEVSEEDMTLADDSMTYEEWRDGFDGGIGSSLNPFLISSSTQLKFFNKNIRNYSSARNYYYKLTSDINYGWSEWYPIESITVSGFDGNYHTIRNIKIVSDDQLKYPTRVSMFNQVGTLSKLTIENIEFVDNREDKTAKLQGAVFEYILSGSYILSNCYVKGEIITTSSMDGVAGFVYSNQGTIDKCMNMANIDAECNVYGIAEGNSHSATVKDCINQGTLKSKNTVAGIVCSNTATVEGCINEGTLVGNIAYGIAESTSKTMANCINEADITGTKTACGIAGRVSERVTNCKNTGAITGVAPSGNAYGIAESVVSSYDIATKIESCINYGEITAERNAAGVIGSFDAGKYWSVTATECGNEGSVISESGFAGGVIAKSESDQECSKALVEKCYNKGNVTCHSTSQWIAGISATASGGITFMECYNEGTITGTFPGGIVSDLGTYIEDYTPLISGCYNLGDIVTERNGRNGELKTGGIVSSINSGRIENSYNAGNITGMGETGGIIGHSQNFERDIAIVNCYNCGAITDTYATNNSHDVGGLVGSVVEYDDHNYIIQNCYNVGEVKTPNATKKVSGQLFGYVGWNNRDKIEISGCYYPSENGDFIGQDTYFYNKAAEAFRSGVHDVTLADMKKADTFEEFDFANIWSMGDEEYPYPVLSIIGAGDGYKIIYYLYGGKNNSKNVSRFMQDDIVTLYSPTRKGYKFDGWYSDLAHTIPISTIDGSIKQDVSVYAKWLKDDDILEPITINGSGYGHLVGYLYDDQGNLLKDRGFNWKLYDITDGSEKLVTSDGAISGKATGMINIPTERLENTSKSKTITKKYRIRLTILENGSSKELRHVIESDVNIAPFKYKQSWDAGADLSAKLSAGLEISEKLGEATLEGQLAGINASGGLGRHISVEQEVDGNKKNLTVSESYSSKIGMSADFGPNLKLKFDDKNKYNLLSFGGGVGIAAGTVITPGLVINDYSVDDNDDVEKLGAFMLNSTALSTGNLVLNGMTRVMTKDVKYCNQLGDSQIVTVNTSGNIGQKLSKLGGLGVTDSVEAKSAYTYSTSDRLDTNIHSVTTSYKTDATVGTSVGGSAIITDELGLKLGNSFSSGAGNSFSITASNINNRIDDDDSVTFTLSDTSTSSVPFKVFNLSESSKTSTQKMAITYSDENVGKICDDVYVIDQVTNNDARFIFNSLHKEMMEQVKSSTAVGNYKRTDIEASGKSFNIGLGVPGASISSSLAGTYSESYTAESGTYTEGVATALTESDGNLLTGTSYKDVVSILNDPLENIYNRAVKTIGDVKEKIEEGGKKVVKYFEAAVDVTREGISSAGDYVVHIFTPNTKKGDSRSFASYEVMSVNSADGFQDTEYPETKTIFTVGEPYLIYLTAAVAEGSEEDGEVLDAFPEGDSFVLSLSYNEESMAAAGMADVNGGNLKVYTYNEEFEGYECIGGERDYDEKTVTVEITEPGQYILGIDDDIPVVRYVDVSDASSTPTITVNVDENSGFGEVRIAVDGREVVNTANYKQYYSKYLNTITYTILPEEALADGEHTLSVYLVDAAGNGMTSPLEFTFNVYDKNLDVINAECYTDGNQVRIRGNLVTEGKNTLDTEAEELIASIKATVTEVYAADGEEPEVHDTEIQLYKSSDSNYITGFTDRYYPEGNIIKYVIAIQDIYGKEAVFEFDCQAENGNGVIIPAESDNDLRYYMPENTFEYTAAQIKPKVYIFDGAKLLTEKKDYTLSYTANTGANLFADGSVKSAITPTITVTGKGNYTLKDTIGFNIIQKSIASEDIKVSEIADSLSTGKVQKPVPTLTNGKKKLSTKSDYRVTYHLVTEGGAINPELIEPKEPGEYYVLLEAIEGGNYSGSRVLKFNIKDKNIYKLISKMSFSKLVNKPYTGEAQLVQPGELVIKDGNIKTLVEGEDYQVIYPDNVKDYTDIGTVNLTVKGLDKYIGVKTLTYKITGVSITKATVTSAQMKNSPFFYTGNAHELEDLVLTYKSSKSAPVETLMGAEKDLYETMTSEEQAAYSYVYKYSKNVDAGKASIEITGVNRFYGSMKKTFNVKQYEVKKSGEKLFKASLARAEYSFEYPATKPKPFVTYGGKELKENKDYKLSYSNNGSVNDGSNLRKLPTVTVKPIGNFKGASVLCNYTITPGDMEDNGLKLSVLDKTYADKKGTWKSTVTLLSSEDKKISAKNNYDSKVEYLYESFADSAETTLSIKNVKNSKNPTMETRTVGDTVSDYDIVPVGTVIRVNVNGVGNFNYSMLTTTYRIVQQDISKLGVSLRNSKAYTGEAVRLRKSDLKFTSGKTEISDVTFEIDETTYKNNVNKGKASVVIYGTGNYGGRKTVTYSIGNKGLLWRLLGN